MNDNPYHELCVGAGGVGLSIGCHFLAYAVPALTLFLLIGGSIITAHTLWRIVRGRPTVHELPHRPE